MHFHLPKPLHGWREFAGEIAIIVVGVLIALGAENLIERWHWHEQATIARDSFKDELGNAGLYSYERLAIQPCLQGRIRELADQLRGARGAWTASPQRVTNHLYLNVMPISYRAPSRPMTRDGWTNAIANGTLNHLPPEQVGRLSNLYGQVAQFDALQDEEARAAARIAPLAYDRQLDDRDRTDMLAALAEVDRINSLMALDASQIIESIRAVHLGIPPAEVEKFRRELVDEQRATRGACVVSPPLKLG